LRHETLHYHVLSVPLLRWNENDRHKVAKMLVQKYPGLGINKLVAAIRECECKITPLSGWDALGECAEERLHNLGDPDVTCSATPTHQAERLGVG